MSRTDKLFGYISIGFIILMTCFCIGWWSTYMLSLDITAGTIVGSLVGLIIDLTLVPKIVAGFFKLQTIYLAVIYILYMVGIFGMFMGVPVFNIIPGILASFYIGRRMKYSDADELAAEHTVKRTYLFSAIGLAVICIASAIIALSDPYTAGSIERMFGLGFKLNDAALWVIVLAGGSALMLIQYFAEKLVFHAAVKV
jgi:hypothetical protein